MQSRVELRCAECSGEAAKERAAQEDRDAVDFWWCRDCSIAVCKSCHLLRGHSEHRTNAWSPEEIYRSAVQALEGRCSRRAKAMHETKLAVKQFVAKVEVLLLNELSRALEASNEPDRLLISRLHRAMLKADALDARPSLYHLPSPTRPAWKTWNLDQEDPSRMAKLMEDVSELLQLPRKEPYEDEVCIELKDRSEWNVRQGAESLAACMGAQLNVETASGSSRHNSPLPSKSSWPDKVRERPSVMSFRERSVVADETASPSSPEPSYLSNDSKQSSGPSSCPSSLPAQPLDDTLNTTFSSSTVTPTPCKQSVNQVDSNGSVAEDGLCSPSSSNSPLLSFGSSFLTRPICVIAFSTKAMPEALAVSDSCGGVYICSPSGTILNQILIKNSSASSLSVDEQNQILYVSVMQSKGRSVHVFDITDQFKKIETITCPKDPKIELSRTRWITVGPRGQLFMTSGDNLKSALWVYIRGKKGWKTLKESRKTRYQYLSVAEDQADYKAVVLLTCDAANNRLLLFVVDHSLSLINEYDLSKTYRLNDHIVSPASAIVDKYGNLVVLDYATGKLWTLLSGVKGVRRLKEIQLEKPLLPQEALGICAFREHILIACFNRLEVRAVRYLQGGVFLSGRAPSLPPSIPRSSSLPRPEESSV